VSSSELVYVGHATVLVSLDGVRLVTDPLLRSRVSHLRRAGPVDRATLGHVDAVLVSHAHYDHLDLPSLDLLRGASVAIVPRGLGPLVRKRGLEHVVEVDEGEEVDVLGLRVLATHADHDGSRPFRRITAPALGYAILGSKRLYFAGDTDIFPGMDGLVSDLDVALLPIWGWGPTLGRGKHLDPDRAAEALVLLRPRIAVPIHWGTYRPFQHGVRRLPKFLTEPGALFARAAAERAPEVAVEILEPGDSLAL
jgi:L-ascorbate metabolism protein UlaG (beta-lactamase superfamily)